MAMATIDAAAHKKERAALQARLKDRDQSEAAKNRALEELQLAQRLVAKFERTAGYLTQFELAFSAAAKSYSDLNNVIPNELSNGCRDEGLKTEFANAMAARRQLLKSLQDSQNAVRNAQENLANTRSRITDQRGQPVILEPGEYTPWNAGVLRTVVNAIVGDKQASWAISHDEETIEFDPGVHPENAKRYTEDWQKDLWSIQRAETLLADTAKRLTQAEDALAECKRKMIWSVI